ncbi:MAG: tetratricopeptide repeat protein [Caldilineaceae bacterium]
MKKSVPSPDAAAANAPSFDKSLEDALKHIADAAWLGENSPLAAPYLLHEYLPTATASAEERGAALQRVLRLAAKQMEGGKYRERNQVIIKEYYFAGLSEVQMYERVNLVKSTFHVSRKRAILALEAALINLLKPAIRLEAPPLPPTHWIAREQFDWCQQELNDRRTVAITGSGGVGKTTLGSVLARQWQQGPDFWFTLRPGLNDQPTNLIFALGYFLSQCDEPSLWLEVVASAGKLEIERAFNMMRFIFERLEQRKITPLLCFDEIDLLQPATNGEHTQMVRLLDSLRTITPLLLIGQQALVDADVYCPIEGLTMPGATALLAANGINLAERVRQKLYTYTRGNLRLLELAITLESYGESIDAMVAHLAAAPSLAYLLSRILQRLDQSTCRVMLELSVYQAPAPADIWRDQASAEALQELLARHLAHADGRGGVMLLPAYRDLLYRELPEEKRRHLHNQAAAMLAARGAYTAAAHQCVWAGKAEQAIWLWRDYQHYEINQGQGQSALHLLRDLKSMSLSTIARQALLLLCANLERLAGNTPQAQADIHAVLAGTPLFAMEAYILNGVIANDLSEFDQAEHSYRRALHSAELLVGARLAHTHKGLGWMYMRQRDVDKAWEEALFARYEAENFQGYIQEIRCDYPAAEAHYLAALQVAQDTGAKEGIAKICNNLATLYARQGRFDEAKARLEQADECFAAIGKLADLISANISWAFISNLAGDYAEAVDALQKANAEFERFGLSMPVWQKALINQGLAEAYLGLGALDQAQAAVLEAIAQEEADILPDSYRTLGEIMLVRGQLADAEQWIRASIELVEEETELDAYLSGFAWRALAQVYLTSGDAQGALAAKELAIERFSCVNLAYEVNRTQNIVKAV